MKARILRSDEWSKTDEMLAPLMPYCRPEAVDIVVVEDGERVVAQLGLLRVTHLEGLWVDPEYRGNAGVMLALLRQAGAILRVRGEKWAIATMGDEKMIGYGKRLGKQIPAELFALWVGGSNGQGS